MATGTMSSIGSEVYFHELCKGTVFDGSYKTEGRPFSTHLQIIAEKAEAALDEILEDAKMHGKALVYLDSYSKRDLRKTVEGLKDSADLKYPPKQTASKILRLLDGAYKTSFSEYSQSRIEEVSDFIRRADLPFNDGDRKYDRIENALDGKVFGYFSQREEQFFSELLKLDEKLVRAALEHRRSVDVKPYGKCGRLLGSSGYCMEMLTKAFPRKFLDNVSGGTSMSDAIMNSAYTVVCRVMEDLAKAADRGDHLAPATVKRVGYIVAEDLLKLNPRARSQTGRLDDLLGKLEKEEVAFHTAQLPRLDKDGYLARDFGDSGMTGKEYIDGEKIVKSKADLYKINKNVGRMADKFDERGKEYVQGEMWKLWAFSLGDASMEGVVKRLIQHFFTGNGSDYSNPVLTQRVREHASTKDFIEKTKAKIIAGLKSHDGDLRCLEADKKYMEDFKTLQYDNRPKLSGILDLTNGLTISLNDTWGSEIEITNYWKYHDSFGGTLHYIVYDHFSLDTQDISGKNANRGDRNDFAAWYVLQYYENAGGAYKPFVTKMEFDVPFNGTIN